LLLAGGERRAFLQAGALGLLAAALLAGTLQLVLLSLRTAAALLLLVAVHADAALFVGALAATAAAAAARPWARGSRARTLAAALLRCAGGAQRALGAGLMAAGLATMIVFAAQFQPEGDPLCPVDAGRGTLTKAVSAGASDSAALAAQLLAYCDAHPPCTRRWDGAPPGPVATSTRARLLGATRVAARIACNVALPAELRMASLPLAARAPGVAAPALVAATAMLLARVWLVGAAGLAAACMALCWAGASALRGVGARSAGCWQRSGHHLRRRTNSTRSQPRQRRTQRLTASNEPCPSGQLRREAGTVDGKRCCPGPCRAQEAPAVCPTGADAPPQQRRTCSNSSASAVAADAPSQRSASLCAAFAGSGRHGWQRAGQPTAAPWESGTGAAPFSPTAAGDGSVVAVICIPPTVDGGGQASSPVRGGTCEGGLLAAVASEASSGAAREPQDMPALATRAAPCATRRSTSSCLNCYAPSSFAAATAFVLRARSGLSGRSRCWSALYLLTPQSIAFKLTGLWLSAARAALGALCSWGPIGMLACTLATTVHAPAAAAAVWLLCPATGAMWWVCAAPFAPARATGAWLLWWAWSLAWPVWAYLACGQHLLAGTRALLVVATGAASRASRLGLAASNRRCSVWPLI
jgi:hypothetical protein